MKHDHLQLMPVFHIFAGAFTVLVAFVLFLGDAASAAAQPAPEIRPRPRSEEVVATLPRKQIWERLILVARPGVPAPQVADVQHIFGVSAEFARPVENAADLTRFLRWRRRGMADGLMIIEHGRGLCRYGTQPSEFSTFCARAVPTVWIKACCIFGEGPQGEDGCPTVAAVTRQLTLWGWTRRPHDFAAVMLRPFHPPEWDVFHRDDGLILLSPSSPVGESEECIISFEIHRAE